MRKKIISFIAIFACAFSMVISPFSFGGVKTVKADTATPMDMYLIAGQSNAAGYSIATSGGKTFDNVWYAGQTDRRSVNVENVSCSSDTTQSFADFKRNVTVGLGVSEGYIGPEYGMASVLAKKSTADHPSFIFKTAAGNTGLLDEYGEVFGNWYPRSLWEEGYEPVIDSISTDETGTGVMYKLFLDNFERVYNELIANGYAPKVKGMAWMQGERDSTNRMIGSYVKALKVFIADIRADLAKITGDETLSNMPFVIGEVACTFGYYDNPAATSMSLCQRTVAEEMKSTRVASFSTDDLIIVSENGTVLGTDTYHYSFADATTLGERFANKLLELNKSKKGCSSSVTGVACVFPILGITAAGVALTKKRKKEESR